MKDSCISLSYSLWLVLIVVAKLLQNNPWIFVLLNQHTFPSTPFASVARRALATTPSPLFVPLIEPSPPTLHPRTLATQ
jgi:hypothetical protein